MKRLRLYFVITLLLLISSTACNNSDGTEFEGRFRAEWELSSFVPCDSDQRPGFGNGYWVNHSLVPDFGHRYLSTIRDDVPDDFLETGVYVRFIGELSPSLPVREGRGGYGQLGAYTNEITVTRLIEMSFDDKCLNE